MVRSVYRENRYGSLSARAKLTDEIRETLDSVLEFYGHRGFEELVERTHRDAPWLDARRGLGPDEPSQRVVRRDTMLDFYSCRAIEGGDVPQRRVHLTSADADEASSVARSVIARWKEGLALLATK